QSRRARGGEHLLEHRVAGSTVTLEERDLRLDDADSTGRGLDAAQAELAHARRIIRETPVTQQGRVRVDAEAQRTVPGDDRTDPRGEGLGHRAATRAARSAA